MKKPLVALLTLGLGLSGIGVPFSGFTSYCDGYWFVWPFIGLAATCAVAAATGLKWPAFQSPAFWLAESSCFLLPFASWFAISRWPGGDDGPGMGWLFIVIPASLIAAIAAIVFAVLFALHRSRSKHAVA